MSLTFTRHKVEVLHERVLNSAYVVTQDWRLHSSHLDPQSAQHMLTKILDTYPHVRVTTERYYTSEKKS